MAKAKEKQGAKGQGQQQEERQSEGRRQPSQALQTPGESGGRQTGVERRGQYAPQPWAGGSPFAFMRRFSEEMDRLFEDFGFGRGLLAPGFGRGLSRFGDIESSVWSPQVEVFERGGQLVVRADLPGMTRDDINIEVTDDALVLRGERKSEREENEEGYYRSERSYGSFYRRIPLPEGAGAENADATFRNGVLEVTMPVPERAQQRRRRLEIREGAEGEDRPRGQAKAAGQK
jgi:HSP20 family protein